MMDKIAASVGQALHGLLDGATVMVGGFGTAGTMKIVHTMVKAIADA